MSKYSVEEVRAMASDLRGAPGTSMIGTHISLPTARAVAIYEALCAYAERIEADERLVPRFMTAQDEDMGGWLAASLDDPAVCTEMKLCVSRWMDQFTHPPAQAAQVDPAAKLRTLADFVNAPDAERALTGQQVAARVDEMMAEPVAQGEAVGWLVVDAKGKRFTIYNRDLAEAIKQSAEVSGSTLTVMAVCEIPPKGWYCPRGADHAGPCAAWENTQPAQSVDVEKVREVIADLREYGDEALADKLNAALQEKGNG